MSTTSRVIGFTSVLFVLNACGGGGSSSGDSGTQPPPPTTPTYSVTTSVAGSGSGSISPTSRTVSQGNTTSFTISPAAGSEIDSASGCSGTLSGNTFTTGPITANCIVTASFRTAAPPPPGSFAVSTSIEGTGTGTINPSAVNVIPGGSATFNLFPSSNSIIAGVSGCGGTLAGASYTTGAINAACVVTAVFNLKSYTVSTFSTTGGSISPSAATVQHGGSASFQVMPEEGYEIDAVSGCGGSLTNSTYATGPIVSECVVSASFKLRSYLVTATAGENGSINPQSVSVSHGSVAIFTVIPDTGYTVQSIGGCGGTLSGYDYHTGAITSACQIGVAFSPVASSGRWDIKGIGLPSDATQGEIVQLSADGLVVLGSAVTQNGYAIAFRWSEPSGFHNLILENDLVSSKQSMSSDGNTIVGESCRMAHSHFTTCRGFLWREGFGIVPLILPGDSSSFDFSVSADGSIAWGRSCKTTDRSSCRQVFWTIDGGLQEFTVNEDPASIAGVTPDGRTVLGSLCNGGCYSYTWDRSSGEIEFFRLEGFTYSIATSVSRDGAAATGYSMNGAESSARAFYWSKAAGIGQIHPIDTDYSSGEEVSEDGSVALLRTGSNARLYVWSEARALEPLFLAGDDSSDVVPTRLPKLSSDGRTVIGQSCVGAPQVSCRAFVHRADLGTELLVDHLDQNGSSHAWAVSANGGVVAGSYSSDSEYGGFVWTTEHGTEVMPNLPFSAISSNGAVVGGRICNPATCELVLMTAK